MGVRGLTSMIEQYPSLFTKHRLYDARLVIDGYALLFYLYFDQPPCDDGHHGGRYQNFAAKCHMFFLNLAACDISPYLVFDGAYEKDNKKLAETKSRSLDSIRTAVAISGGNSGIAVSPCTVLVFMEVLDNLSIPYAFCDFEADAETAALANAWNCAAASRDSDFYILDLKAGYLPLNHFDWKNLRKGKIPDPRARKRKKGAIPSPNQLYIECMKYDGSKLCKMFHVKQALLPVLATAVGNDYKDTFGASLDPFHGFVHSKFSRSKSGNRSFNQIMSYLAWLSEKESVEEAIRDMVKHVRGADQVNLRQRIEASLEMYHLSNSLTMVQFSDGPTNPSQSKLAECTSVPLWFDALLKRGKVAALCANVLCNKRVFLRIQVEDSTQPSAGVASRHIRSVLYGILLLNQKSTSIKKRLPVVEEYAQWSGTLKHSIVEPVYEIFRGEQKLAVPSLEDIPAMLETDRRQVLLATIGINGSVIDDIQALFKLATCVTVYLIYRADPPVHSDQVMALIVSWLHGVAASIQRYISKGQDTPEHLKVCLKNSDVHAILRNCKAHKNKFMESRKLDVEVIQAMAQWQQCLLDLVNLNKVLLGPCPNPDLEVLYNGPLIHSMCSILRSMSLTEQRQWVVTELLAGTTPSVQILFDQLLEPSWPLLTPRKKTMKSKKGKRVRSRGSERQSSRTPAECGGGTTEEDAVEMAYGVNVFCRFEDLDLDVE